MNLIKSKRNQEKLSFDGNMFSFDRFSSDGSKKFWRCDKRDSHNCKVRIHTDSISEEILKVYHSHTHDSEAVRIDVCRIHNRIKNRATSSNDNPSQIINRELLSIPISLRGSIPKHESIKRLIQRNRNQETTLIQFDSRENIQLSEETRLYEYSPNMRENFLQIDTGIGDSERILVFGRNSHISWSGEMHKIYMDGTFNTSPLLFSQIYIILAERVNFIIPILYALLPNKSNRTYCRLFQKIKDLWPNFNPTSISTDFEIATINAIRTEFPSVRMYGCFFHLVKNIKKHIISEGLISQYNSDPEFSLWCRMIGSIAFVPIERINDAFMELFNAIPEILHQTMNWFEDNYIGRLNANGSRRSPLFSPDIWSVYQRTLIQHDRTNNHAEAAHRRMKSEFGFDHPTLHTFIKVIKRIQAGQDQKYEEFIRGENPPVKRTKYVRTDERILRIVQTFQQRSILEYLRGLAHNFLME